MLFFLIVFMVVAVAVAVVGLIVRIILIAGTVLVVASSLGLFMVIAAHIFRSFFFYEHVNGELSLVLVYAYRNENAITRKELSREQTKY